MLQDVYAAQFDASDAGIDFRNVIYEGSERLWQQALQDPGATVEWVVVNPQDSVDLVGQRLKADPGMLSQFTLYARQSNGVLLYHHVGRGPLPTRPAPARWQGAHYPFQV